MLPEDGAPARCAARAPRASCSGAPATRPFETPVFEDTELFARGVGESTDIVQKEMFTFEDQGGRSLTLRPEGTAGVCRAYVEHGMHKLPQPVKLWYWGPFFRHEAPQAGRFRQFTQVGAEALGSDDPSLDAELILLLAELLERGRRARAALRLSSLGNAETRRGLRRRAARATCARARASCPTRCGRASTPTRCAPSTPTTRARGPVMADAPRLLDRLDAEDAEHFADVRALLDDAGHAPTRSTRRSCAASTTTRARCSSSRATRWAPRAASAAAGATTGWSSSSAGPPTPGVGWAAGIERILLAAETPERGPAAAGVRGGRRARARARRRSRSSRALRDAGVARARWSRPAAR